MENFKKEIWERDNLHLEYSSLNNLQIQQILHRLAKLCNVSVDSISNSSIFIRISEILKKETVLLNINEKEGFKDMCSLLKLNLHIDDSTYVIWNYNNIDKISVFNLQNYWDYIWFGASDEVCLLYFSNIESLIMVNDYGTILCSFPLPSAHRSVQQNC